VSLIDEIERLGKSVENGTDLDVAVDELRALLDGHVAGREVGDRSRLRAVLSGWRDVRHHYEAVRSIPPRELTLLRAALEIETERREAGGDDA
jgi:hypothetical protein